MKKFITILLVSIVTISSVFSVNLSINAFGDYYSLAKMNPSVRGREITELKEDSGKVRTPNFIYSIIGYQSVYEIGYIIPHAPISIMPEAVVASGAKGLGIFVGPIGDNWSNDGWDYVSKDDSEFSSHNQKKSQAYRIIVPEEGNIEFEVFITSNNQNTAYHTIIPAEIKDVPSNDDVKITVKSTSGWDEVYTDTAMKFEINSNVELNALAMALYKEGDSKCIYWAGNPITYKTPEEGYLYKKGFNPPGEAIMVSEAGTYTVYMTFYTEEYGWNQNSYTFTVEE